MKLINYVCCSRLIRPRITYEQPNYLNVGTIYGWLLPWLVFPNFVGYNVRRWIIDINKKSCLRKPVLWGVHNWLTFCRNSLETVSLTMYRILVQQPTTLFKIGVLGGQKFDSYKNCANFNFYLLTKLHKKFWSFFTKNDTIYHRLRTHEG